MAILESSRHNYIQIGKEGNREVVTLEEMLKYPHAYRAELEKLIDAGHPLSEDFREALRHHARQQNPAFIDDED